MAHVSDLAREDLADMRADGLCPTDEDVVRLHALALRITNGQETTAANAPRFAVAGGVVFHEPTVAAFEWYDAAKTLAGWRLDEDWLFAFALANGRRVGYLSNLTDEREIRRAVKKWKRTVHATKGEVACAVYYAATGNDDIEPELTELAKKNFALKSEHERERENYAKVEAVLRQAAVATGLTMSDLLAQGLSRLQGMIYEANVRAGMELKPSAAKAHAEYLATVKAVRERLTKERDATAKKQ